MLKDTVPALSFKLATLRPEDFFFKSNTLLMSHCAPHSLQYEESI